MNGLEKNGTSELLCGGRTIGYVVRPGRCRSVTIVVTGPGEVEVRVPRRVPSKAAHAFVAEHAEWILRALARQAKVRRPRPLDYVTGETVYYLGKPCRLEVTRSVWKGVTQDGGVLRVALFNHSDAARVKELVEEWLREQARERLAKVLAETLERFGGQIRRAQSPLAMRSGEHPDGVRLTVRAMKTRWGSCSRDGHVTLSEELIHAPLRLIEYVAVHELCHLAQLNHSPAFYFQLASCLPDWRQRRRELQTRSWLQAQVQA